MIKYRARASARVVSTAWTKSSGAGFSKARVHSFRLARAGKTVLANEICFRHAAAGGRAAYVTLLAEMHTRLLQHLRPMAFFDESVIPDSLYYMSAFTTPRATASRG